jgi:uncharacterized delta-60 repeat protein
MALLPISPYIAWKGLATNSAVPSYSRPDLTSGGAHFKANPIKHWRKQLIPTADSGNRNRRAGVGMPADRPGGAVYLGDVVANTACLANASPDTTGLKENILNNDNCVYDPAKCNSRRPPIRPSTTLLSKTYYTDHHSYMRSRGNLYDQKLTALPVPGITYLDANGHLLTVTGDNATRQTQDCTVACPLGAALQSPPLAGQTIYKPNNAQYAKQGAVDSSDRLTRLKLNTVNKNAASYKEVFGSSASRYLGMASTPYFVKSKYQACVQKDCAKFVPPPPAPPPPPPSLYGLFDPTFVVNGQGGGGFYGPVIVGFLDLATDIDSVLVGGSFTGYYESNLFQNIMRLNASDGSYDTDFNSGTGFAVDTNFQGGFFTPVNGVLVDNGKIVVTGSILAYNDVSCNYIARLNEDGSRDTSFDIGTGFNAPTFCAATQFDSTVEENKILVGGNFTDFNGNGCNYIARLDSNGNFDSTFNSGTGFTPAPYNSEGLPPLPVLDILVNPEDSTILACGYFIAYNDILCNSIVRLLENGTLDPTFNIGSGFNFSGGLGLEAAAVFSILRQSTGKIIVGGIFTDFSGNECNSIARLNADGTFDDSFGIGLNNGFSEGFVTCLLEQTDGKIVVGGYLNDYNGNPCMNIARLDADGNFDTTFDSGPGNGFDNLVASLAEKNGQLIVGGVFENYTYNGNTFECSGLARLNESL